MTLRRQLWEYFSAHGRNHSIQIVLDSTIFFLITLCLAVTALDSYFNRSDIHTYSGWLYSIALIVFSSEWICRVWSCVEDPRYKHPVLGRIKFCLSPLVFFDLLAILPAFFLGVHGNAFFMRVLRLFEVSKYLQREDYSPLSLITKAFVSRKVELIIIFFTILAAILMCSYGVYFVEKKHQPDVLVDIIPSFNWAFSLITGYGDISFSPITITGKTIRTLMMFFGAAMIGLPVGILTGAFVEQISENTRLSSLRNVHLKLKNSFNVNSLMQTRTVLKSLGIEARARYIKLNIAEVRLGLSREDIIHAIGEFGNMRLSVLRFNRSSTDDVVIEDYTSNVEYGTYLDRGSKLTVVSTQNSGDPFSGHFAKTLSDSIGANYLANEFFSSGSPDSEHQINFSQNDEFLKDTSTIEPEVLRDFVQDLERLIKPDSTVIYIGTTGTSKQNDLHVLFGGEKGDQLQVSDPIFSKTERVVKFYSMVKEGLDELNLKCATHEEISNTERKHLSRVIHNKTGADVLRLQVSTTILWDEKESTYYKVIATIRDAIISEIVDS